jgi:ribose transport system ATP-binding protein
LRGGLWRFSATRHSFLLRLGDLRWIRKLNIRKSFDGVPVLKDVNFSLKRGEIHALMGENGAGKSTLMNVLGGVIQPDDGEVFVEGRNVTIPNPRASQALGISFIH